MAMIVRQLLNNRSNPCRRLCRALIPCYFKQTQTLISTQSSPFSPPQTSSEIPPFKTKSQHRRALYSPGVVRSLRNCLLDMRFDPNVKYLIKSTLRGLLTKIISCRREGKVCSLDISIDSILYNPDREAFELPCHDSSNFDIEDDFDRLKFLVDSISSLEGIPLEDFHEFNALFSLKTYNDTDLLWVLLFAPALSFFKMRNRLRQWSYSKFTGSGPIDNDGKNSAAESVVKMVFNHVLTAQGLAPNHNWKVGLTRAIGQAKFDDWTSLVIKFKNFKDDNAWDFLRFSRILVVHTRDQLHVVFEVIYRVNQYPLEFTKTWSFEDLALSMDSDEFELAPTCPPFQLLTMKTPKSQ
ncbi:unnamed protein product [Malus baccata var. baccata]